MSIVLNVSFHCSAKEIRPEFLNPISVGEGIHPLEVFPSPRDSKMRVLAQTTTFLPLLWCANAVDVN